MRILLTAACLVFLPQAAQASFFVNCDATGTLSETKTEGTYIFKPEGSTVTGGHIGKGEPCMTDKIGKELKIKIEGPVETGENVTLKYRYYNAMGENGVVEGETWGIKE